MDLRFEAQHAARERFHALDSRRQARCISVAQLCRRADVSESTYARLLKSPQRVPHFRTLNRLATALSNLEA